MIGPWLGVFIQEGMRVRFLYQIQVQPDNQNLVKEIKFAKIFLQLGLLCKSLSLCWL